MSIVKNSPLLTHLCSPAICNNPVGRFPKTLPFIRRDKQQQHHDMFTYDSASNGPHEHENHAPLKNIAQYINRGASFGRASRLLDNSTLSYPTLSRSFVSQTQKRYYASKFTVTDGRDALFSDPDFTPVQRTVPSPEANRAFSYFMVGATGVLSAMGAKSTVMNFLTSWSASSEALAMAQVEVDLSNIPKGKSVVMKWRGKPIFIRHRTPEEIQEAESVDLAELRDPQPDEVRTKKPEWIVMLGICTHLGCVPLANSGDYNGWYCPCHGSHYDISGRIRKGPAPTNLEVPEYKFIDDSHIVIG